MKEKTYTYRDSGNVQHVIEINEESFKLTQADEAIHDVKFKTKPTTFFKDALKRFAKNKASVAGAIILGTLLVFSFILPLAIPSDTSTPHPEAQFLEPKLFDAGVGFWDGTRKIDSAICSTNEVTEETNNESNYKNTVGYFYPEGYEYRAVMNLTEPKENYVNVTGTNVRGGSVLFVNENLGVEGEDNESTYSRYLSTTFSLDFEYNYDLEVEFSKNDDYEFENGEVALALYYEDVDLENNTVIYEDYLTDFMIIEEDKTLSLSLNDIIEEKEFDTSNYDSVKLEFVLKANSGQNAAVLIDSLKFNSSNTGDDTFNKISFTGGNEVLIREQKETIKDENGNNVTIDNKGYWRVNNGFASLRNGIALTCSFTLDTYENALGIKDSINVSLEEIANFAGYTVDTYGSIYLDTESEIYKNRTCDIEGLDNINVGDEEKIINSFKAIENRPSPIISINKITIEDNDIYGMVTTFDCKVYYYRYKGYGDNMPRYLFGTDTYGKDLLKIVFAGLRTSLLLGIFTFVVCFSFGLVLGSIEGYYGGWTDIILQRFTEILSGVPWIVIMTLCILSFGSNFWTFAMALCLTGWIGVSNVTRTQFYRFKGREYILASRTLGARDSRLIFRHILPNSMGTIITSSVLMIPSVIFSEATISYLGLGLQNIDSLGVILSDNQKNLATYPYTLITPAVVIALIMIAFNLFGNGLRDAFNPSLKGED